MDLESEGSALESGEENEVNQDKAPDDDENGTLNNVSFANESYYEFGRHGNSGANTLTPDHQGNAVEVYSEEPAHLTGKNHAGDSPPVTKGYGLKKWRRIRREIVKDPNTSADSSKVLKRGLSGTANSTRNQPFPHIKQNSESSIVSSNMFMSVGLTDAFAVHGSSSDSRYVVGSAFTVSTDSENSEDRSSKSSTAASAPKLRYDLPPVLGREKSRVKNMSSKNFANSTQRVQQGKGRTESSKKPKGERIKMEKENYHSSIDSDSRSSNFKQGVFSVASYGKHSGRPIIYDKGNSDEAHNNEHFPEEVQAGYCNENLGEDEDPLPENVAPSLSWNVKEGKSENHPPSAVEDPFIESIRILQSVQEALEEEVQKLGDIRSKPLSPDDDSIKCSSAVDPGFLESSLSGQSYVEGIKLTASGSLELQVLILTENVNVLERKLAELQGMLAMKDSRIAELETALRSYKFPKEESGSTIGLSDEKFRQVESELEGFFRQKIEAEIEYLAITNMMQNLKVGEGFQVTVLAEHETLSRKQAQVLSNLGEAESKASVLKIQAEELENYCGDVLAVDETFMMQKRVCKVAFYFFVQLMLLILVFWFFVLQLPPNSGLVVPT